MCGICRCWSHLPSLNRRAAHDLEHTIDLVDIVASGEQGAQGEQLSDHGTRRPHVHCGGVVPGGEEDLWGPVPPR